MPLGFYKPCLVLFLHLDNIDAVPSVNGNATASCNKAADLVTGNRIAALGKTNRNVMNTLYNNGIIMTGNLRSNIGFSYSSKNFFISNIALVLLLSQLKHLIDDLAFLQSAVSHCRKNSVPVMEAILLDNDILNLRFGNSKKVYSLTLTIFYKKITSLGDVLFFKFIPEPLIDLILGGGSPGN